MSIKQPDQNTTQLRQEAEAQLSLAPDTKGPSHPAVLQHELQVHQIELEMQNEQLRQAQIELEESRDRYVDLYEFAPVGYLTLTDAGMISEINLTGSTLLKMERNKLLHHRFNSFVAPEHRDRWNLLFVGVLQHDERQSCELALQRGDGSVLHAQLDCLRLAKDGKPPVVRITLADITRLRESEEKFKAIFDSAKDGVLLADMEDKKLLLGNAAACRMLGYTAEEISKLHVMDIHPENDLPYVLSEFEKQARGNKVVAENIPVKRKDGSVFYAEITTVHLNISGKTWLAGFFRDITERKQAEEALLQSEADIRTLVEHSPIAMIVDVGMDADEKIVMMNQKFTELFGYTMEDVPDVLHWWPLAYPDEKYREEVKDEWIGKVGKAIQNHSAIEPMETTVSCKDGSNRYIKFSLSSIGSRNIITFEDLTGRKHQEERTAALLELSTSIETLDEKTLLQRGLDTMQHLTDSRIGFLHFVSEDQSEIELVTWSNDTLAHYCQAAFDRHYPVSAAGIWADCIRLKQAVIINDYATAPGKQGLPEGHSHLQRFISVPIFEGELVRMIVGVGNAARDYGERDAETVKLFGYDLYHIVQRKRADDSLRKLSLAVEQSPSSIIITDLDANIEYANAAFVKTTGYSLAEAIGQNPRLLHSGKTPRATYDDLWAHLTRGEMWKGEFINRRKDGSEYVEAVLFSPVRGADGRVTNYLAIKEDITERKQAEATLIEQIEELRRWHDATIGREMRVLDLKHEVNELLGQTGQPPRYPSAEPDEPE